MRSNNLSVGLTVVLTALTAALLVIGTRAAAQETVLHSFSSSNPKFGDLPLAGLIFDGAGNLYGTTNAGGAYSWGAVFELTPKVGGGWTEKVLHSFNYNNKDGANPSAGLIFDAAGNLYGTTAYGGTGACTNGVNMVGCGTVFELTPQAGGGWKEKVLHNFRGKEGAYSDAALIFDAAGNLYGTTFSGGAGTCTSKSRTLYGCGTVFELTPATGGSWTATVLYSFKNDGIDGIYPYANVIFDAAGNLYGTTYLGGASAGGTVFELMPVAGGGWTENVLRNFSVTGADGYELWAGLILDAAGNLYGVTSQAGAYGGGAAFELTPSTGGSWTETRLYSFGNGTDGRNPFGGLVFDAAGNLYGTTASSGANLGGTAFELTPVTGGGWTERVLYNFENGANSAAGLVFDTAGNLYGTTSRGGATKGGTVFEITP